MMTYLIMAMATCFIGIVPLLMARRFVAATCIGAGFTFLFWFFFWLESATTVGPFFGPCLWIILAMWVISAGVDSVIKDQPSWIFVFPVVLFILRCLIVPLGSEMMRSSEFASLVGPLDRKVWTQDIQVKDPRHIRLSNMENAIFLAKNSISRGGGNVGSQFQVSENSMTLQKIRGVFWYVAPLDFINEYGVWSNTRVVPGYIMISAENDGAEPVFKDLPDDKKLKYTPNAFFDFNLERHLRINGYLNVGLIDYTFEIDDDGNPWWVISTYQPTIFNSGEKITGVVVVDPFTGAIQSYSLEKLPAWIDRAMPKDFVKLYLTFYGNYSGGWINSWWGKNNILKPEDPILIYAADNSLEWVTGMTSSSDTDTALVALVYTNSRTGKSVYYETHGGSTDSAIKNVVFNNQFVKIKNLHPADPQIYNLYGTMASIMPLLNDSHAFQGVAIVDVRDIQKVAVGLDFNEALNSYRETLGNREKAVLDKTRTIEKIQGIVGRIHSEYQTSGTIYRVHLRGIPYLFVGGKSLTPKLTITEPGDSVKIEYYSSGETEIPMYKFDNESIDLKMSSAQKEVTERAMNKIDEQKDEYDSETTKERFKDLSPQQIKELEKYIPEK